MKARRTIDFEHLERLATAGATAAVIIEVLRAQEGKSAPRAKRPRKVGEGSTRQHKADEGAANQSTPSQIAERELFTRGKQVLGKTCGGLITALVKFHQYDLRAARAAIEDAATKSDPREFVVGSMRSKNGAGNATMAAFDDLLARAEGGEVADGPPMRDVTPRRA